MNEAKLYVGGLPYRISDEDLTAAFAKAGTVVDVYHAKDKFTGRSKGFGFVEMASAEEAQAAIEMWNEKELQERTIYVNVARPREER